MSLEPERIYVINLGKVLLSQSQHRSVRAINMIREFARHHMKVNEIKIDEALAQQIWARGVRRPPRKIRVRMNKVDDHVLVSSYDALVEPDIDSIDETPSSTDTLSDRDAITESDVDSFGETTFDDDSTETDTTKLASLESTIGKQVSYHTDTPEKLSQDTTIPDTDTPEKLSQDTTIPDTDTPEKLSQDTTIPDTDTPEKLSQDTTKSDSTKSEPDTSTKSDS